MAGIFATANNCGVSAVHSTETLEQNGCSGTPRHVRVLVREEAKNAFRELGQFEAGWNRDVAARHPQSLRVRKVPARPRLRRLSHQHQTRCNARTIVPPSMDHRHQRGAPALPP